MGSKGNRNMRAKARKAKNRNRYARFSGATSKYSGNSVMVERVLRHGDIDPATGKRVFFDDVESRDTKTVLTVKEVYIDTVKFSNGVINTGRGPNPERMQQYYNTVRPKSFVDNPTNPFVDILKMKGLTEPFKEKIELFIKIRQARPKEERILLVNEAMYKIEAFKTEEGCVLLKMDLTRKRFSLSRPYHDVRTAKDRLVNNRVVWKYSI